MASPPVDIIAFDADDTLWHNERSYRDGRDRFCRLLAAAGVTLDAEAVDAHVNRTENANLPYYGYGVSSFTLSLMESAIELTHGRISGAALGEILELAKGMLTETIELFPHTEAVLAELAASFPLMLITKGDLLHQTSKLERSGLRGCFRFVEIVSHKTADVYAEILARRGVDAARFLMVGNSVRSDILPIVELGGRAVHVPAALSWAHEDAAVPPELEHRCFRAAGLDELPGVIARLSAAAAQDRLS